MKKRWLGVFLSASLLLGVLPMGAASAETTYYTEEDLGRVRCTILSDPEMTSYVNRMMKYHILSEKDNYRVARNLKNGDSVVFFFDGCSDLVNHPTYSDYTKYRLSAYCAVVQEVDGKPVVVYESEKCSTIPDNPRNPATNEGTPVPTVRDGVYNIISTNHGGSYAALRIQDNSGSVPVVRCTGERSYVSTSSAINIHARSQFSAAPTDGITPTSYSSAGCFNVGFASDGYQDYNAFIKAVLNVSNGRHTKCNTGVDHGVVIVDRTNYRTQLEAIYGGDGEHTAAEVVSALTEYTDKLPDAPYFYGDVNGDGKTDPVDYLVLTRHTEGAKTLADEQIARGDVNGDGKTDSADCAALKEYFRK